ncbi:MAG TPA: hypothetical protein VKW77_03650, partial [Acidimicrobiales bacterium]|nr:hypothetical protein [Acidimicrobiales bacterium]
MPRVAPGLAAALAACVLLSTCARGQGGGEVLDRPEGRRLPGRIEGDARSGFRFALRDGGAPIALEPGAIIRREGSASGAGGRSSGGPPPFHLLAGEAARLSGRIRALSKDEVRWAPAWEAGEVTLPR